MHVRHNKVQWQPHFTQEMSFGRRGSNPAVSRTTLDPSTGHAPDKKTTSLRFWKTTLAWAVVTSASSSSSSGGKVKTNDDETIIVTARAGKAVTNQLS
jgi:hypothetical protein